MGIGARFVRSDLKIAADENTDTKAATTFAVDISAFYQSEEIAYNDFNGRWRVGINLQNIGPKINYNNDGNDEFANFMPANLPFRCVGLISFLMNIIKLVFTGEVTKLLVPTPPKVEMKTVMEQLIDRDYTIK